MAPIYASSPPSTAYAQANQLVALTVEFDNRGSKVMDQKTSQKILGALADSVFKVPAKQVSMAGGMGQSSLLNHKSTVTYLAVGSSLNGKSLLENCNAAVKGGWFSKAVLEKAVKKATDTWAPGDSVTVKSASCSAPQTGGQKTGRKLL